jgi:hypothetical protein
MKNTADVIGGKPIAVFLPSISRVSAINPLSPFTTSMEERERFFYFSLPYLFELRPCLNKGTIHRGIAINLPNTENTFIRLHIQVNT